MSEANVKTNRTVSTKWTYQKDRNFAGSYFMFLKVLFQVKSSAVATGKARGPQTPNNFWNILPIYKQMISLTPRS